MENKNLPYWEKPSICDDGVNSGLTIDGRRGPFTWEYKYPGVTYTGCCPCVIKGWLRSSIPPYEPYSYQSIYAEVTQLAFAKTLTNLLNNLWDEIK